METALKFIQKMIFYTNINYKIMSKVYFIILIFFFGWLPSELYAQNVMPPNDCYLNIDSTGSSMMVKLPDTLSISEIDVQIGTSLNSNDVFSHSFEYDSQNNLPNGTSYNRNNEIVLLGIGSIDNTVLLYSRVRLKYLSNNWSSWYQFTSN